VRIGAGSLRGRRFAVPPGARPTESRVREALFSIWQERLPNALWLDLFAGSGAMGIEALSRGALSATFVESDRGAVRVLERNLALLAPGSARLVAAPAERALTELAGEPETQRFDLVFADPPYAWTVPGEMFAAIARVAAADAELAIEHAARASLPDREGPWVRRLERRYGDSALSVYGRLE
jgi:16S rRNA (guanine966-N2)-methyltransferase